MAWDQLLKEASEHVRRARYDKAIDLYRTVLSTDPNAAAVRFRLAEAYRLDKNLERAFHHYSKAAAHYEKVGDQLNALKMLKHANTVQPNQPDILHRFAECCLAVGSNPELEAALVQLVKVATRPGDRRRLWALEKLHELHPNDAKVAERRAMTLSEVSETAASVKAFVALAESFGPSHPEFVRLLLCGAQACQDRTDLAMTIAKLLVKYGRPKEALSVVLPYYEKDPEDIHTLEGLLASLDALNATDKARAARVELLKLRANRRDHARTVADAQTLLRLAPADRMVIEVCAHAFAAVGEIDRAAVLWRRVAGLSAREGDFASRDRAVAALLHVNPDDETGLELLAQAHAQAGRLDESLAARQRLSELRRNKVRQTTPIPEIATDPSGPSAPRAESDIMELSDADVMVIESSSAEIHGPHEGAESEDLLPTGPHAKRSPMGGAEVDSDSFAQPNAVTEQVTAVETLGNNTDPLQPSLQKDTETGSKPSPIAHGNREGSEVGTQPAIETQGLIDDLLDDLQGPQKGG